MGVRGVEAAVSGEVRVPLDLTPGFGKRGREGADILHLERGMGLASRGERRLDADMELVGVAAEPHAAASRQLRRLLHFDQAEQGAVEAADRRLCVHRAADLY